MTRSLVLLVVVLSVCHVSLADEIAPPPKDIPPVLGLAVLVDGLSQRVVAREMGHSRK